jgi:formate dehydrogenase subunit delta
VATRSAKFYIAQGHDKAVAGVAEHLGKFWDLRMRDTIIAYLQSGGAKLNPCVREAVGRLSRPNG